MKKLSKILFIPVMLWVAGCATVSTHTTQKQEYNACKAFNNIIKAATKVKPYMDKKEISVINQAVIEGSDYCYKHPKSNSIYIEDRIMTIEDELIAQESKK